MQSNNHLLEAQDCFIRSYPTWTAADFDPAQLAQWAWDESVFSFFYAGQDRFPALQFDANRQPLPILQRLLPLLATRFTNWEIALWFTSSNPNLDNCRPVDLFASQPEAILQAARTPALTG
jgi:hypothetical protein